MRLASAFALSSVGDLAVGAGHDRHAGRLDRVLGGDLVAHHPDVFGLRADEGDAGLLDDLGELGVLGQEAVARVDRLRAGDLGGGDDGRDVEVGFGGGRRADADALVREADVHGVAVGFGMDGHRVDAHLLARAVHAEGDLATVRNEDFLEHRATR